MTTTTAEKVAQRKATTYTPRYTTTYDKGLLLERLTYGVPPKRRILTAGVLRKRHSLIVDCLVMLGFPNWRRSVILELVRLYAYYGKVYPKAKHIAEDAYCSKRTFWRTIAGMEQDGLIQRDNRYLNHLQISNAYRLDRLVLILVRYITEHAEHLFAKDAPDLIFKPADVFWTLIWTVRVRLRDPVPITA
ncbi:hypothetical protein ES703_104754 [subsurface metagenome]